MLGSEEARRRACLATCRDGGPSKCRERIRRSASSDYTRHSRIAAQIGCRDYWARMYGEEAERASRGGVMWI